MSYRDKALWLVAYCIVRLGRVFGEIEEPDATCGELQNLEGDQ